jgi:hypothetical protein
MNCQQFQEVLPHIIDGGGTTEDELHLRTCTSCATLAQDLKHIAARAKLLLPMHEPSPRVWENIERSLQREGLIGESRNSSTGRTTAVMPPRGKSGTLFGWVLAVAAVLVLGWVLARFHSSTGTQEKQLTADNITRTVQFEGADQELMSQVSRREPGVRNAYQDSLTEVNAYIVDAKKAVAANPNDASARLHLMDAYDQKAMLFEMGTVRALQ